MHTDRQRDKRTDRRTRQSNSQAVLVTRPWYKWQRPFDSTAGNLSGDETRNLTRQTLLMRATV